MKKIIIAVSVLTILNSCVVSTAAKAVKGVAKIGYKTVKGTVKGVSWAVSKANGKIDEDRINGTWKVVGIYKGSFEEFSKTDNVDITFTSTCTDGSDQIIFKSKQSKLKPLHCIESNESWTKYSLKFGKNPLTKEKENYIEINKSNYITVIDVNNKTMILQGILPAAYSRNGSQLYLLEKI